MDHDKQTPPTGQDTDPTKAQSAQQPAGQPNEREFGQAKQPEAQGGQGQFGQSQQSTQGQSQQQPPQGQADYGSAGQDAGQSDTATQQRSDIEGGTATGQASGAKDPAQFVGAQGGSDTSGELIEDDEASDFAKDGQGAPE